VVVLCNLEAVHGSILGVIALALFDWATSGVEDSPEPQPARPGSAAIIVRNVLFVAPSLLSLPSSLLTVDGRKVLDLRPGANDVRGLSPGIYFVGADSRWPSAASRHKVIVTR